jgi:hypothetical protein
VGNYREVLEFSAVILGLNIGLKCWKNIYCFSNFSENK